MLKTSRICLALLLLMLPGIIMASPQSFSVSQMSQGGQKAYQSLLTAERFEDKAIGFAASPSELVESYRVLLKEPSADAAFKSLLENATLAGQLYALSGIYFTDPNYFQSAIQKYEQREEMVETVFGCIIGGWPVSKLVESHSPIVIDRNRPVQSLNEWLRINTDLFTEWNGRKKKKKGDRPPVGYELDILNGGYPVWFRF